MAVLQIGKYLWYAVVRLYTSAVFNHGNVLFLVVNFMVNFSPVFIWLTIFKNAGLIPNEARPKIRVKLVYYADIYFYNLNFLGIACGLLYLGLSVLLYLLFFRVRQVVNWKPETTASNQFELDSGDEEERQNLLESERDVHKNNSEGKTFNPNYPPGYSAVWLVLLLALSWPILNIDFIFAQTDFITRFNDILAWVFYVLCHLIVPIVTAVYLYVFHAPGALKYFSIILGCQNIAGVLTHLVFPNAAPWFIHLYGLDAVPDYDMPGFAAGLTRADVALGTHLSSKGFHKSPIVFGAFPSLHSAMAVQVFLHLVYYSNWRIVKAAGSLFVAIQWWATIYLDHHFRLDLMAGMMYAYFFFMVFQPKLHKLQKNFHNDYFYNRNLMGTTMGMRVFRGTVLQNFFDPYK